MYRRQIASHSPGLAPYVNNKSLKSNQDPRVSRRHMRREGEADGLEIARARMVTLKRTKVRARVDRA